MLMEIARNCVFDCHLSTNDNRKIGRQMAIENPVSNDYWSTFVDSINFSIAGYPVWNF